ncbi:uncharacterized protein LOC132797008 [Drosophila nasuta]|uniref:uncharacterized protein LOC132797008 n=1 Tax=Drosophila nasuta TaxID=42062 RepID=UPI00295EDDBB|nr:uncharacterized protein LOC132797008 [Drosophila nasuta]
MSQEQMASLAQIVQGIKNNPSSETSQQMLRILKQNPQIMAAIIKRRQQREMSAADGGASGGSIQFGNSCQQQQQEVMTQQPIMVNAPPPKTLAEIMQKIKDTPVDENSQRMLHILKQNPPQREINDPAGEADDGALQDLQQMMEDMMMNK